LIDGLESSLSEPNLWMMSRAVFLSLAQFGLAQLTPIFRRFGPNVDSSPSPSSPPLFLHLASLELVRFASYLHNGWSR
jgi:hypothetical protein